MECATMKLALLLLVLCFSKAQCDDIGDLVEQLAPVVEQLHREVQTLSHNGTTELELIFLRNEANIRTLLARLEEPEDHQFQLDILDQLRKTVLLGARKLADLKVMETSLGNVFRGCAATGGGDNLIMDCMRMSVEDMALNVHNFRQYLPRLLADAEREALQVVMVAVDYYQNHVRPQPTADVRP